MTVAKQAVVSLTLIFHEFNVTNWGLVSVNPFHAIKIGVDHDNKWMWAF
jgi:hypothetical protein